jgi:hypothetical protein
VDDFESSEGSQADSIQEVINLLCNNNGLPFKYGSFEFMSAYIDGFAHGRDGNTLGRFRRWLA